MENSPLLSVQRAKEQVKARPALLRWAVLSGFTFAALTGLAFFCVLIWEAPIELTFIVAAPAAEVAQAVGPLLQRDDLWRSLLFDVSVNACLGAMAFAAVRGLWRFARSNQSHRNSSAGL